MEHVPEYIGPIGLGNAIVIQEIDHVATSFGEAAIAGISVTPARFWHVPRGERRRHSFRVRCRAVVYHDDIIDGTRLTSESVQGALKE
jgi:hypothetical protein